MTLRRKCNDNDSYKTAVNDFKVTPIYQMSHQQEKIKLCTKIIFYEIMFTKKK